MDKWQLEYSKKLDEMAPRDLLAELIFQLNLPHGYYASETWTRETVVRSMSKRLSEMEDELAAFHTLHDMKAVENG